MNTVKTQNDGMAYPKENSHFCQDIFTKKVITGTIR